MVVLDDLEETELELGFLGNTARGTLRIACLSRFARRRLADVLARHRDRYPQVIVDVSFEDRLRVRKAPSTAVVLYTGVGAPRLVWPTSAVHMGSVDVGAIDAIQAMSWLLGSFVTKPIGA